LTVLLNAMATLDGFIFTSFSLLPLLFYTIKVLSPQNPQISAGTIRVIHLLLQAIRFVKYFKRIEVTTRGSAF